MPAFVRDALRERGVLEAYLGWITRAKLKPTQQKRLAQMLDELARGNRYMKMAYRAKHSVK